MIVKGEYRKGFAWRTVNGQYGFTKTEKEARAEVKKRMPSGVVVPMVLLPPECRGPRLKEFGRDGVLCFSPFGDVNAGEMKRQEADIWRVEGGVERDAQYRSEIPFYSMCRTEEHDEKANLHGRAKGLTKPYSNRRVQAYALFMALATLFEAGGEQEVVLHFKDADLLRLLLTRCYGGGVLPEDRDAAKLMDVIAKKLEKRPVHLVYIPDFKKCSVIPPMKKKTAEAAENK